MADRTMKPAVFRLTKDEAGVRDKTVEVRALAVSGTFIKIEPKVVEVCYTKVYDECETCDKIACPFSGFKER